MAEYTNKEVAQLMLAELHRWYNKEVEYDENASVNAKETVWLWDGTRHMLCGGIPAEVCMGCSLCDNPLFNKLIKDVSLGIYDNEIGSIRRLSYITSLIYNIAEAFVKGSE